MSKDLTKVQSSSSRINSSGSTNHDEVAKRVNDILDTNLGSSDILGNKLIRQIIGVFTGSVASTKVAREELVKVRF